MILLRSVDPAQLLQFDEPGRRKMNPMRRFVAMCPVKISICLPVEEFPS
jgi:hypothetical protein